MAQKRLSKDDARELILSTAQKRFEINGLDGLKLTDIGKDAGITHSNILHHFGNRDGLLEALIRRMTTRLATDILDNIKESADSLDRTANLQTLFETLSKKGHARLIIWMLSMDNASERAHPLIESLRPLFDRFCDVLIGRYGGDAIKDRETVRYFLLLITTAAVGDGVAGGFLKKSLRFDGDDKEADEAGYLSWLADVFKLR